MEKKLVIIPTYNEIENISKIIEAVFALEGDYQILVIDDGSPDGTGGVVKALQQAHPERLHLIERSGKLGLGTAYVTGFKWALERDYDYIFEMDADFSHNPADLPRLLAACTEGGETVTMLANETLSAEAVTIASDIVLDLAGFTLYKPSGDFLHFADDVTVTIRGGTWV